MPDGGLNCASMKSTFVTLIHPNTPAEWIASQAASLARILARLDVAKVLPGSDPACGLNMPASFAHYDPLTHSLKTAQCSLFEDLTLSSVTLPRSGSMRNGRLYPRPTLALRISVSGSGYWPTPRASPNENRQTKPTPSQMAGKHGKSLCAEVNARMWPTIRATDGDRGGRGDLIQAIRGNPNSHYRLWQTPVADDAMDREKGKWNSRGEPKLSAQVKLWPTPTVCGNHNRKGASKHSGDGLATVAGGSLNPTWVEWLMGWPTEWTASKHWVTVKSRSKRQSLGKR